MLENIAAIRTALRVLTAVTDQTGPSAADVEQLRAVAPEYAARPPDVLAYEVVQQALESRLAAMKTALRVLTAITDRTEPSAADVEELRALAPEYAGRPPAVLAYIVVQQALESRGTEVRED